MAFDRITEEIAHFIGVFHLDVEAARLRLEYDAFAVARHEPERTPAEPPELVVSAPHALKGFTPGLTYAAPQMAAPLLPPGGMGFELGLTGPDRLGPPPAAPAEDEVAAGLVTLAGRVAWVAWELPEVAPNSIIVMISQTAVLHDNDLVLVDGSTPFVAPEILMAEMAEAIELVAAEHAPGVALGPGWGVPRLAEMEALAAAMVDFAPADGPFETQLVLRGAEALGVHVSGSGPAEGDGEGADGASLPDFVGLLPAFLADGRDDDDGQDEKDPFAAPPRAMPNPPIPEFGVEPGHVLVTGANTLVNEVIISQAWVDAPVIAVAGDAIRLDVVSQVIHRQQTPEAALPAGAVLPSTALNAVEISIDSAGPVAPGEAGRFPQDWSVVRVEGDLIALNHIQQFAFVTDFDRVEVSIEAAATYFSTGENVVVNAAVLRELGFHYDLILVGGDMVTLNQIHQSNVLLDVDTVHGLPEAGVSVRAGDNLQLNRAEITQTGRDEMVAMEAHFRTALEDMAQGVRDITEAVARDARFEGKAALNVLQIEGDLIKANIVEQYNYLGDSDQIGLMLEAFLARGEQLEVITGSNAQMNAARLQEFGLDSTVLVAGTAYSDALIHQAQLIDPEAPPTGVGLVPLASEAVAFLADGMAGPGSEFEPVSPPSLAEHAGGGDVMQSVLT